MPTKRDLLLALVLSLDEQKDNLFDSFRLLSNKVGVKISEKYRLIDVMIQQLSERTHLDHFQTFLLQLARLRLHGDKSELYIDFVLNHFWLGKQKNSQQTQ